MEFSIELTVCSTTCMLAATIFFTCVLIKLCGTSKRKQRSFPRLPSVPILGSMPFMSEVGKSHTFIMEKAEKLGPIFTANLSGRLVVYINGRSSINEAFVKQSLTFASRPLFVIFEYLNPRCKGIINHPYDSDFRKFHQMSLSILRRFGYGQGIMENRIKVEVEDLVAHVKRLNGKTFCPDELITTSVSNVILSIILGNRYDHSDRELKTLIENSRKLAILTMELFGIEFLRVLRFLPFYRNKLQRAVQHHDKILEHMNRKIDAGLKNELQESFITHYLDIEGREFDREQLLYTLRDLFFAGAETSSTFLLWALVLLANHRDVQQKFHAEIVSVVSKDRLPSLDDRKNLPYVEATILELLRRKTALPLGGAHATIKDTVLNGCFLPKGSVVFANLYSCHMDPKVWDQPEEFRPERFLDAEGNVTNRDCIMSFSVGKRSCLGEILGQQEVFLFLTGLVQHFEVRPPEGHDAIFCEELFLITLPPSHYHARLIPRIL